MAHIVINAMSLRPGGGLQVMAGLAARFSDRHRYTILWTDTASREVFRQIAGERPHIDYVDPLGSTGNVAIFRWGMSRQAGWLRTQKADCVLGVNHHFPSGGVPQMIYHLNVLRFERPRRALWAGGELADRLRDWRAAKALTEADANLFESDMLFDIARKNRRKVKNGKVVYIGLDDRRSSAPRPNPDPSPIILALTSPQPHKDNGTLIRMLAELVRQRPDVNWSLRIAGGRTPGVFAELQDLAAELGVADRVEFLGFCTHDRLAEIGARSLCLVSASLVESFCMVALEAMSWGCPAIVADTSAMPESIGDAGLLARPSDPADFAGKVLALWNDRPLRDTLIERGLARAAALSWTNAARTVETEIEHIIDTNPTRTAA